MRTPRVTVIVPTYNRAGYLAEAIGSVLAQTFDDFEVVVVDDGSTDGTAALVGAFDDARVRYLYQDHRGISAAMNAGVRSARGDYVARLDSDDRWLPHMLAALVPVLDARPAVGVVYGRGQAMDREGRLISHVQGMPERFPGDALRSLAYDDCTCNIALLVRRACFDRVGLYDETLPANEDWDMWLRVARHYGLAFVDQVLACIRWHDGNLTGPASPHFALVLETRTAPLDKLFSDPDLPAAVRALRPAAYANVYLFRGLRWLGSRHIRRASREFGAALRVSDERLMTLVRILWFALAVPAMNRSGVGRRAIKALATLRSQRRARRAR